MSNAFSVFSGRILPNAGAVVQGRVVTPAKELYTRSQLASISYRVVRIVVAEDNTRTGVEIVVTTPLIVSDVIFDSTFAWDESTEEANFRHVIGSGVFTVSNTSYQIQYVFTGTDGTVGGGLVEPETMEVL